MEDGEDIEVIKAWRCIGCGRVEASRPCVGVCQDRAVQLVPAEAAMTLLEKQQVLGARLQALEGFLTAFVRTHPRDGQWQASFVGLQQRAARLMAESG